MTTLSRPRPIIPEFLLEFYLMEFGGNFPEFYLIESKSQWSTHDLWPKLSKVNGQQQKMGEFLGILPDHVRECFGNV